MRRATKGYLAIWLVLLTAVQTALLLAVFWAFVRTRSGQAVDTISLTANTIGYDDIEGPVTTVLDAMSVAALAAATGVVFFIAVFRRRFLLACVAAGIIAGSNVSTQVFKFLMDRPDFGIDPDRAAVGNTLPSGHTTIAASVAVALILVLPRAVRPLGAVLATAYAAFAGVATLSAGWHRPSDAVAAYLVVGAWTAACSVLLVLGIRREETAEHQESHKWASTLLLLLGAAALMVGAFGLWLTDGVVDQPVESLSRGRLLVAYAGGAGGIAGTACVVLGLVVATVPWVVPARAEEPEPAPV